MGILLHKMLVGKVPYDSGDSDRLMKKIIENEIDYSEECWAEISIEA